MITKEKCEESITYWKEKRDAFITARDLVSREISHIEDEIVRWEHQLKKCHE